jgi:dethiobiotin synthetase
MFPNKFFVTAISTDSGKTAVSGLLCKALGLDYWKPVQAGEPTDIDWIQSTFPDVTTIKSKYQLSHPMSPHAAAERDGVKIALESFEMPDHKKGVLVEGAGGVLVPLNSKDTIADLVETLELPVVLVSNYYLGSINHTLLTIRELERRGIEILGVVFNGEENIDSKKVILEMTGLNELFSLPRVNFSDEIEVEKIVEGIRKRLL